MQEASESPTSAMLGDELPLFLRSRRGRLHPADVGLKNPDTHRRVEGLRREEVAQAAGISVDYYARLEQGRVSNVSDQVVNALARALCLDRVEHEHLRQLTRPRSADRAASTVIPDHLSSLVDGLNPVPALLHTSMLDVLVVNDTANRLLPGLRAMDGGRRNLARWTFLEPVARRVIVNWEVTARSMAASLRTAATQHGGSADADLVSELLGRSAAFRAFWEHHDLDTPASFAKQFRIEGVGDIFVQYQSLAVPQNPNVFIALYAARAGSVSASRVAGLANPISAR